MANMVPINIRVTSDEREILEAAASQAHTNPIDFIRRRAVEAAEMRVLSGLVVRIPTADWEEFGAWAKSPPRVRPGLQKLAASRPVWKD